MLYNVEFLRSLDQQQNKVKYAKIVALTMDEQPLEEIEGVITAGSINVDGASAVRRTCQLSLVTQHINLNNYYWGLHTKFKLSIGLKNFIDKKYPDIIWFDQGIFIITNFSTAYSTNSYTINLSGKDKMCRLNGEIGGVINSSVDFGKMDQPIGKDQNGNTIFQTIKYPVREIIKNLVHQYGGEPFHNVIIKDLEEKGLELQEYRYDVPMFIWRKIDSNIYENGTLNGTQQCYFRNKATVLQSLKDEGFKFESLLDDFVTSSSDTITFSSADDAQKYYLAEISYGQTAGYKEIDLVYPDELIANIGEAVTSVLDKIKNFLGEFEYFYNLEGQFVFQKKQSALITQWNPIENTESEGQQVSSLRPEERYSYIFSGTKFFTSFNNTPNISNLKNDFTVWGVKGSNTPIHMRYAIHSKPTVYTTIEVSDAELSLYNQQNGLSITGQTSVTYATSKLDDNTIVCDWREIIYQMARDYMRYNHLDNFELKVSKANREHQRYQNGKTTYEPFYTDVEGFWRQLYLFNEDSMEYEWNPAVENAPNELLFWIDFLNPRGEMEKFSIAAIGHRPKAVNDNKVKSIYYKQTPPIIFVENNNFGNSTGYRYFNVPNMSNMFSKSSQNKTAKASVDDLLYKHSYCIESITINSIPIYYLQPNTCIYINDTDTGISGEYLVNKMTIPLTYNGTMSITAVKAAPQTII